MHHAADLAQTAAAAIKAAAVYSFTVLQTFLRLLLAAAAAAINAAAVHTCTMLQTLLRLLLLLLLSMLLLYVHAPC